MNYRPVSILPFLSKAYERLIYNELYEFVENISNFIICGFRKARSTQHIYLSHYNRDKKTDNHDFVDTILMDFSKAFDCISHELLIVKLSSYGVTKII